MSDFIKQIRRLTADSPRITPAQAGDRLIGKTCAAEVIKELRQKECSPHFVTMALGLIGQMSPIALCGFADALQEAIERGATRAKE